MDLYSSLNTPERCVADFCLIPIGTPSASVSNEVAEVQRLMKASGLEYSMHSAGTTVEGSWNEVMEVIGLAHSLIHRNGIARVQTDIRAGSRTDKIQHFAEKVSKVESILSSINPSTPPSTTYPTPASTPATPTAIASHMVRTTNITSPTTTTQTTSYNTRGPWISASMHLRRSFMPSHIRDNTDSDDTSNMTSSAVANREVMNPGYNTTSIEFRTGIENVKPWHIVAVIFGIHTLRAMFLNPTLSFIEVQAGRPGQGGKGFWG